MKAQISKLCHQHIYKYLHMLTMHFYLSPDIRDNRKLSYTWSTFANMFILVPNARFKKI